MTRKTGAIITAAVVCAVAASRAGAATVNYLAKLSGQIQTATTKQTITQADFVASTNQLLVQIDLDHGVVVFVEASGSSTNLMFLKTLLEFNHTAVLTNHNTFAVTLIPNGAATVTLQDGLVFGGELLAAGTVAESKGVAKSFEATLSGVWNDPLFGNTNAPAAVFKGTISGKALGL